ncbi:MAG: hypothetical protein IPH07_07395 [Deltaproteobacteria bacterium]|nr:hypothetical protein [Deltaproteobacteria bacterium]MBK8236560.1 hypothetical protein [Deltaproteobacteria bacterium]MBK8717815.1 hypothetical protein [Deltaproteobacteria bacterium]MBP7287824.1 hypothetical protein [Nannocystaceae bacterium]
MGWLEEIGNRLFGRESADAAPRVYMHDDELAQLTAVVTKLAPKRVLEWGSGGSTHMFLTRFPSIERMVSVENDRGWYERVRAKIDDPRLSLFLVESDVAPPDVSREGPKRGRELLSAFHLRCEREPALMRSYVEKPGSLGERFDFVLVDGRARSFCIAAGWELLVPGGVLVLHDAQRPEYRDAMLATHEPQWLEPWQQGQICVAHKPA